MKRTFIALLLAAAMLILCAACSDTPSGGGSTPTTIGEDITAVTHIGQGQINFILTIKKETGDPATYQISTSETMLGDALSEIGLIICDEQGMVTTVDGVTLDWGRDHAYWAFYIGSEFATHGVNDETITAGKTYRLEYTPAS